MTFKFNCWLAGWVAQLDSIRRVPRSEYKRIHCVMQNVFLSSFSKCSIKWMYIVLDVLHDRYACVCACARASCRFYLILHFRWISNCKHQINNGATVTCNTYTSTSTSTYIIRTHPASERYNALKRLKINVCMGSVLNAKAKQFHFKMAGTTNVYKLNLVWMNSIINLSKPKEYKISSKRTQHRAGTEGGASRGKISTMKWSNFRFFKSHVWCFWNFFVPRTLDVQSVLTLCSHTIHIFRVFYEH